MLLILTLVWVQAILLAPLDGGGALTWQLWRHYSPAISSMTLLGVFLGQIFLTLALPKTARVNLFAVVTAFLTGAGLWLQRSYEVQDHAVFSIGFVQNIIAEFGQTRFLLLVGGIFILTFARSLRLR